MATYHLLEVQEVERVKSLILPAYHPWLHDPATLVYCAMEDDLTVGAMAVLLGEEVAKIVSLAVSPDYQGRGIGRGLVAFAQAQFADYECERLQVTMDRDLEEVYTLASLFYQAGFQEDDMVPVYRTCKIKALLKMPIAKRTAQLPRTHIHPLEAVPPVALQMYCNQFQLDFSQTDLDGALSMVAMEKGKLVGVLCIQKSGAQEIDALLLHVASGQHTNLMLLMVATAIKAYQTMGPDCTFSAALSTLAGKQLLEKLFPPQEDEIASSFVRMFWTPEA